MFRNAFGVGVMFLVIGATLLATPRPSKAQHGGGHIGGYHGGAAYGGYHYDHSGFYRYDRYHDPYGAYYPYYSGSDGYSSPSYDDAYPYPGMTPSYGSDFSGLYGAGVPYYGGSTAAASSDQSFYPTEAITTPADTTAHITVLVPADARVWFDGKATSSTGAVREFQSPPLATGPRYAYDLRAQWNENGHIVEQTRKVAVTAGGRVRVDFPKDR
jgi:uncharacterized protein (TIGR03000 family)